VRYSNGWRIPSWGAVLVAALVLYGIGRWDGRISAEEARMAVQAREFVRTAGAFHDHLARLKTEETAARVSARSHELEAYRERVAADGLQKRADSLARIADSLRAAQTASGAPDPCAPANAALAACQEVGATLRGALAHQVEASADLEAARQSAAARADVATHRADSVTVALDGLLHARGCTILHFLPCPSRPVVMVLGLAGGLLIGMALP